MKGPGALGPTKPPRMSGDGGPGPHLPPLMSGAGGPRPHLPPRVRRLCEESLNIVILEIRRFKGTGLLFAWKLVVSNEGKL